MLLSECALTLGSYSSHCSYQNVDQRKFDNTMNIAITNLPGSLDPITMRWAHQVLIFQSLYQSLVRLDENGEIVPDLADKWEFSENGKVITFRIDSRSKFSNGRKVLPEDVAFSISRHFWPNSHSPVTGLLSELIVGAKSTETNRVISGITLGDSSISIHLNNTYAPLLCVLSMPSFSIIGKREFIADQSHILGSGPYNLISNSSQCIELAKASTYPHFGAQLNKIRFIPFQERAKALSFIESGSADFVFFGLGTDQTISAGNTQIKVLLSNNPIFTHFFVNANGVLGTDRRLRLNLFRLLGKFTRQTKYASTTQNATFHLIPKGMLPLEYYGERPSPISSKQFMSMQVNPIQIRILSSNTLNSKSFFDDLSRFLGSAGITVQVTILPPAEYMKAVLNKKHNFDLVLGAYSANFPDLDGIIDPIAALSDWSYGIYPASELRASLLSAKFNSNMEERQRLYSQAIREFEDQYWVIPLFQDHIQMLYRKDIEVLPSNYRYESEIWRLFWKKRDLKSKIL
jgi:peptide/nickel transport system substrate-binding protein